VESPWLTDTDILLVPSPTLNDFVPPWNIIPLDDKADITEPLVTLVAPAVPNLTAVLSVTLIQLLESALVLYYIAFSDILIRSCAQLGFV
jgi:hypothetical protein